MDVSRKERPFIKYENHLGTFSLQSNPSMFTTMFNTTFYHYCALVTMYTTESLCKLGPLLIPIVIAMISLLSIKSIAFVLLPPLRANYPSPVAFILGVSKRDLLDKTWE